MKHIVIRGKLDDKNQRSKRQRKPRLRLRLKRPKEADDTERLRRPKRG
jgi:hypothetical protein